MKGLAIGRSQLSDILQENAVYVDKTEYIHKLMHFAGKRYFLSRPRRFGKSLLIDTIKEVFLGNKKLFADLWIGQEGRHDWRQRPVIVLDFANINLDSLETIKESLFRNIVALATVHHIAVTAKNAIDALNEIVPVMAQREKVVLLVDEYDAPLLKHITNVSLAQDIRSYLSNFYTTIKTLDAYWYLLFITGISKFSKTSIFSCMNNLKDISFDSSMAGICGYTQEELEDSFSEHIQAQMRIMKKTREKLLDELRFWYNGYRFSKDALRVYNPFSILLFFKKQDFGNYWFASGTPTFLIDLMNKGEGYNPTFFKGKRYGEGVFNSFEIDTISLLPLMYQSGYITIQRAFSGRTYSFTYPNEEVRQSLFECLATAFLEAMPEAVNPSFEIMRTAVHTGDVRGLYAGMKAVLATVPARLHNQNEAYYHSLLHVMCMGIGYAQSEVATSKGSIDLVLGTTKYTYVIEIKLNKSAEVALAQIHKRRYYEKYATEGKMVFLVGMAFDFATKQLTYTYEKMGA